VKRQYDQLRGRWLAGVMGRFLDLDPERGIKAGQRWQEELKRAAERCEVVIF
jgi:hypothetical protein